MEWQKAVASLFCRAAQGKRPSTDCPALLQLLSGFLIQACVKRSINRCHWSGKKLLPACFAEQHRGRDQALSVQKDLQQYWTDSAWSLPLCCSAKQAGLEWQKAVASLFCRAAQGKRPSTDCPALLQLLSGFLIQACVERSINRCHWSGKKLLPACFAEQHRGRDQALSVQYCCKSLVVFLSRLV